MYTAPIVDLGFMQFAKFIIFKTVLMLADKTWFIAEGWK